MPTHEEHILRILNEATDPLFPSEITDRLNHELVLRPRRCQRLAFCKIPAAVVQPFLQAQPESSRLIPLVCQSDLASAVCADAVVMLNRRCLDPQGFPTPQAAIPVCSTGFGCARASDVTPMK